MKCLLLKVIICYPLEHGFDWTNLVLHLPLTGGVASGQLVFLCVLPFLHRDSVHAAHSPHQEWMCKASLRRWPKTAPARQRHSRPETRLRPLPTSTAVSQCQRRGLRETEGSTSSEASSTHPGPRPRFLMSRCLAPGHCSSAGLLVQSKEDEGGGYM